MYLCSVMSKEDHINYWLKAAEADYKAVFQLFENSSYPQCLFFAHLTIEKLLKAFWVRDNVDNIPPKTHNLSYLLVQTNLDFLEKDQQFFAAFNQFQLEGRYPDYQFAIYERLNNEETSKWLEQFKYYQDFLRSTIASKV